MQLYVTISNNGIYGAFLVCFEEARKSFLALDLNVILERQEENEREREREKRYIV